MEERIEDLAGRIDAMLGRLETDLRDDFRQVPDLVGRARTKMAQVRRESGEAWADLKPGFENAWKELRTSFRQAGSRFK